MVRSRGFTLIELLVVIVIILILAAILFPVFATAREKGREASCASNLKQIGMAAAQYNQDYDEIMPAPNSVSNLPGNPKGPSDWVALLAPYIKSNGVWFCPDATTAGNNTSVLSAPTSYAWSATASSADQSPYTSKCGHPDTTFLVMDRGSEYFFSGVYQWCERNSTSSNGPAVYLPALHMNGKNILFADYHVKYVPMTQITARDSVYSLSPQDATCLLLPGTSDGTPDPTSPYYSDFEN